MMRLTKDPNSVEAFHIIWCGLDGTNDGSVGDDGELQGAAIASSSWTVPAGITLESDNTDAVSIAGITYAVNTVATFWLSSGTDETDYVLTNRITTNETPVRTLDKSVTIQVRSS